MPKDSDKDYVPVLLLSLTISIVLGWMGLALAFWTTEPPAQEEAFVPDGSIVFIAALLLGLLIAGVHAALHAVLLPFVASKKFELPHWRILPVQRRGYTIVCTVLSVLAAAVVGRMAAIEWGLPLPAQPFLAVNVLVYAAWLILIGARKRRSEVRVTGRRVH